MVAVALAAGPGTPDEPVAFFLVGDTHILATKEDPEKLDDRSAALTAGLVNMLNKLPGTEIPESAGGGTVAPRGLIHAGDIIDTGDAKKLKAQATEWTTFADWYGLTGKDGKLKMPIYEVHGNHDGARGDSMVVKKIIERNKNRPGVTNVSKNGVHYSWDWGRVHFVNLGVIVGQVDDVMRKRRYGTLGSLDFLIADLKEKVGTSGRPVVITHHVDMLRYSQPLPVDDKKAESMEWDPADVKGYYDALRGYNIAGILYGHTHARTIYRWDGSAKAAKEGIPVFNVSKSSHFSTQTQAFFYIEVRKDTVLCREYQTKDGWETGSWAAQTWSAPIARVEKLAP
jgi:cytolysin (calcineurin-like family phosphatase)